MKKKWIATGMLVALATVELNVSAAGVKDIFSAQFYADEYKDLKAVFEYNADSLYQHALDYGLGEGRMVSPVLDLAYYRAKYPDLNTAFAAFLSPQRLNS